MTERQKKFPFGNIGVELTRIRGHADMAQFAEFLGITERTLYRYERGERKPNDGLLRLARSDQWSKYQLEKSKPAEINQPMANFDKYPGHTTDELTDDEKMSTAVASLIQIYDSEDPKMIRLINRLLREFCAALASETKKERGK